MHPLSGWDSLILAPLLAAALYGFWLRFQKVAALIRQARPDPSFSIRPLAPRIFDFFWEVLCQAKVIAQRPLPGLAHAFVFWGFCSFALVTINHFSLGFGFELFSPNNGFFGPIYFFLAACFAVTVSVSILGLAVRRAFVRPKWLGEFSMESLFIAFLIFALMATYLADYLLRPEGLAFRAIWWSHTAAILVFLPLIPHTKHLHLVLSPVTVFLSRGKFSYIPPLDGDEDFGLIASQDITQLTALQSLSCVECGRCTEHCPANNTGKLLDPKEIILGFRAHMLEFGVTGEQPLLGKHLSQEAAFQCTTCGACEFQCPVGIEHLPLIVGLRRGAVNTGAWDDDHGGKLFLNLERYGNPLGFSSSERDKFLQKLELPLYDGSQQYLLWLGCMGSYDPQGREIVTSLVQVLRHHNISFGVLRKEKCSGDSARRLGNDLLFQTLAEHNIEAIGQAKVLSTCPHCVRTLGEDYREFGAAIETTHHSELLASLPAPQAAPAGKTVYHDPCYLGRYAGAYDSPRQVASMSGELVEAPRHRERSFCCGAGGGLAFLGEESGTRVSHERTRELAATGASTVAAACPFCNTMFRDALAAIDGPKPQLLDIAQIAAAALPQQPLQ
jgi:Fe-S oxidoreductase